jgi:hypothetical protein
MITCYKKLLYYNGPNPWHSFALDITSNLYPSGPSVQRVHPLQLGSLIWKANYGHDFGRPGGISRFAPSGTNSTGIVKKGSFPRRRGWEGSLCKPPGKRYVRVIAREAVDARTLWCEEEAASELLVPGELILLERMCMGVHYKKKL